MFFGPPQRAEWYHLYSSLSCAASKIKLERERMSAKDGCTAVFFHLHSSLKEQEEMLCLL